MRDKLEGDRPAHMEGVNLQKSSASKAVVRTMTGRDTANGLMAIAAIVAVLLLVLLWNSDENAGRPISGKTTTRAATTIDRNTAPDRAYASSEMVNVVVAGFAPSYVEVDGGDTPAKVHLIGKDGLEMETYLPDGCQEGPVEARLNRVVRIRADTWSLRGGGSEQLLSQDDARAAMCGDFTHRDVARKQKTDIQEGPGR